MNTEHDKKVQELFSWISQIAKDEPARFPGLNVNSILKRDDFSIQFDHSHGRTIAKLVHDKVEISDATQEKAAEDLILADAPTHKLFAEVLHPVLNARNYFFERSDSRGGGQWYKQAGPVYTPEYQIRNILMCILENQIRNALTRLDAQEVDGKERAGLYRRASKALVRCQTVEFINRTGDLLKELLGIDPVDWNCTPDTLPCTDALIDFSGPTIKTREPEPGEYWRDPVPFTAAEITESPHPAKYEKFLFEIFPDLNTNLTARYCRAAAIRGTGAKTTAIACNEWGNGAKNTDFDVTAMAVGSGMMAYPSEALVTKKGDSGERRFDAINLRGARFAVLDEVSAAFDVPALKRLTSLSEIRGEAKGQDAVTFRQTWVIFLLTNKLPNFYPPDDSAFLNRLIVIPYQSVFYESEEQRQQLLDRGADPEHLLPARDKREIIAELEPERPGILRTMIEDAIALRDEYGGKVPESDLCRRAKESYRSKNDRIENFINEMIQVDSHGKISNARLHEIYKDFSGDHRTSSQSLITQIRKKIPSVTSGYIGSSRAQVGIMEISS